MTSLRFAAARGFTLIELIIVMVVLGIAAVSVISLSSNIFMGLQDNRDTLAKSQLMQECFESLLAKGRYKFSDPDLATTTSANAYCQQFTLIGTGYAYGAPTVTSLITGQSNTTLLPDVAIPACPYSTSDAKKCKLITITHGSMSPIYLMLVEA